MCNETKIDFTFEQSANFKHLRWRVVIFIDPFSNLSLQSTNTSVKHTSNFLCSVKAHYFFMFSNRRLFYARAAFTTVDNVMHCCTTLKKL